VVESSSIDSSGSGTSSSAAIATAFTKSITQLCGVAWRGREEVLVAQLLVKGRRMGLGTYSEQVSAARSYDAGV
jgi:hypothetical protein